MYAKYAISRSTDKNTVCKFIPKLHHHIRLDQEFKLDCEVWIQFLSATAYKSVVCHPMIDLSERIYAEDVGFSSDASVNLGLSFGCTFGRAWTYGMWEPGYVNKYRSGKVNSKSFVGKDLLRIKWKFELN